MTETGALEPLLQQLRGRIGMASNPAVRRIEAGALRKFARATGQSDPLLVDEVAATAGPYGALLAAPTYVSTFGNEVLGEGLIVKDLPFSMFLHTDDAVELFRPLLAGDEITAVARYADAYVREGANGPMLFQIAEITLTNQHGEDVALVRVGCAAFNTGRTQ